MGTQIREQVAKYLTAFQLVIALLWYFIQFFGIDTNEQIVFALALVMLSAFVYRKDKDVKLTLHQIDLTPKEMFQAQQVLALIHKVLGIKPMDVKGEREKIEARIAELQGETDNG